MPQLRSASSIVAKMTTKLQDFCPRTPSCSLVKLYRLREKYSGMSLVLCFLCCEVSHVTSMQLGERVASKRCFLAGIVIEKNPN